MDYCLKTDYMSLLGISIIYLLSANFIFLTGCLGLSTIGNFKNKFERIFLSFLAGLIILISCYSVVKTSFLTVNIFLLFPILATLYLQSKKTGISLRNFRNYFRQNYKQDISFLNLTTVVVFLFSILVNWTNYKFGFSADTFAYAGTAQNLTNGFENRCVEIHYLSLSPKVEPYHYFELWLTAFLKFLNSEISLSIIYQYITLPILLLPVFFGLIAIHAQFSKPTVRTTSYVLPLILIAPFITSESTQATNILFDNSTAIFEIPGLLNYSNLFSYFGTKNIPIFLFFILFLFLLIKGEYRYAYISLTILYAVNTTFLTTLFPAVTLVFFYNFFWIRNDKTYIYLWLFHFIVVFLIAIFYVVYGEVPAENQSIPSIEIIKNSDMLSWKGIVLNNSIRVFVCLVFILLAYSPYIFICRKYLKNHSKTTLFNEVIILSVTTLFISILSRAILFGTDSIQFVTYTFPIINVTITIILLFAWINKLMSMRVKIFICILVTINITISHNLSSNLHNTGFTYFNLDKESRFQKNVLHELKKQKKPEKFLIGFILEDSILKRHPGFMWKYFLPGKFLNAEDFFNIISLNYPNYKTKYSEIYSRPTSYNLQKLFFRDKGTIAEFEKHLIYFVLKKKCKYIICRNDTTLPISLQKLYNRSFKGSNETFWISDIIK